MSAQRQNGAGPGLGEGIAIVAFALVLVAGLAATTFLLEGLEAPVRALIGALVVAGITVVVTVHTLAGAAREWLRASVRRDGADREAA